MGMFTIYCVICGGPPYDPTDVFESEDGDRLVDVTANKKSAIAVASQSNRQWLSKCVALTEDGVERKILSYDSYGSAGGVTVSGQNWGVFQPMGKSGLLAHLACFQLYRRLFPADDERLLWSKLFYLVDSNIGILREVDYGASTVTTWSQFYSRGCDSCGGELLCPNGKGWLDEFTEKPEDVSSERPPSPFPLLNDSNVALLILQRLEVYDICQFAQTCKRAQRMCRFAALWKHVVQRALSLSHPIMGLQIRNWRNVYAAFPHHMRNAERVVHCVRQLHALVVTQGSRNPVCQRCTEIWVENRPNVPNVVCESCGKQMCTLECDRCFWFKDAEVDGHFKKFAHPWKLHPAWNPPAWI